MVMSQSPYVLRYLTFLSRPIALLTIVLAALHF